MVEATSDADQSFDGLIQFIIISLKPSAKPKLCSASVILNALDRQHTTMFDKEFLRRSIKVRVLVSKLSLWQGVDTDQD